mmetsp:Transcript_17919/g.44309  ORF Transcript_17919/g.44309 Transcript_17919/m.44309 type:complete len:225 (+) Transcript_17919:382-1056(+)
MNEDLICSFPFTNDSDIFSFPFWNASEADGVSGAPSADSAVSSPSSFPQFLVRCKAGRMLRDKKELVRFVTTSLSCSVVDKVSSRYFCFMSLRCRLRSASFMCWSQAGASSSSLPTESSSVSSSFEFMDSSFAMALSLAFPRCVLLFSIIRSFISLAPSNSLPKTAIPDDATTQPIGVGRGIITRPTPTIAPPTTAVAPFLSIFIGSMTSSVAVSISFSCSMRR